MKPPSTIAWRMVLPFRFASFKTSSACEGRSRFCSTKSSATCLSFISTHVSDRNRNHFFGGRQAGQNFANAVFAQGAHAKLSRALAQVQSGAAFVDHVTDVIVEHENFENAHAAFVAGAATLFATLAAHDLGVAQLPRLDPQCAKFTFA